MGRGDYTAVHEWRVTAGSGNDEKVGLPDPTEETDRSTRARSRTNVRARRSAL